MDSTNTCNLTSKDRYSAILSDCRAALERLRAPESAIQEYLDRVTGILDDFVKQFGDGVEVRYSVSTHFKKALLKIEAQGEKYNPSDGDVLDMDSIEDSELQPLLRQDKEAVIYGYHAGQNVVRVVSPRIKNKTLLSSPLLWGAILGLALGFLCALLPDDIRNVIVNDVVSPVKTVTLNLIFCVMGPVILVSMNDEHPLRMSRDDGICIMSTGIIIKTPGQDQGLIKPKIPWNSRKKALTLLLIHGVKHDLPHL